MFNPRTQDAPMTDDESDHEQLAAETDLTDGPKREVIPTAETPEGETEANDPSTDDLTELRRELSDIDGAVEESSNRMTALDNRLEAVEESVERIDEHIAELLGMYDAFQAGVNPLVDGDMEAIPPRDPSSPGEAMSSVTPRHEPETAASAGADRPAESPAPVPDDRPVRTRLSSGNLPLDAVPEDEESRASLLEWLNMMVTQAGGEGAIDALAHYHGLGWLGDDAHGWLRDEVRDRGGNLAADGGTSKAEVDHERSLAYIDLLAA